MQRPVWKFGIKTVCFSAVIATSLNGAKAFANDDLDKQTPTLWLSIDGGYSIYKSELVASNDTSTTIGYGFGVYGGQNRNLGLFVHREMSTFDFKLVQSGITMSWQDTVLRYRFGLFYAGLVLSQTDWLVNVPPFDDSGVIAGDEQEFFEIQGSGYGANFGFDLPLSKDSQFYIDTIYSSAPTVQLKARGADVPSDVAAPEAVLLGSRMTIDIGASLGLTRSLLDGMAGFKYRTYNISVDGTSYAEQHHTTYVGLRCNWTF